VKDVCSDTWEHTYKTTSNLGSKFSFFVPLIMKYLSRNFKPVNLQIFRYSLSVVSSLSLSVCVCLESVCERICRRSD